MKRFLLILLLTCPSLLKAQSPEIFIDTKRGAAFYEAPTFYIFPLSNRRDIDYTKYKKKKLGEIHVPVICLANRYHSLTYDSYVIDYKGKRYFIYKDDVLDNEYLDRQNLSLSSKLDSLTTRKVELIDYHKNCYDKIFQGLSFLKHKKQKEIEEIKNNFDSLELDYIKTLKALEDAEYNSIDKKYLDWVSTLPQSVQRIAEKFALFDESFDVGYTGACEYSFGFVNRSSKKIKYIYWTLKVVNGVGDYLSCNLRHTSTFSGRYVGPCQPYATDYGQWGNIMYNGEANSCELNSLRIVYSDGSSLSIDKKTLEHLILPRFTIPKFTVYLRNPDENKNAEELQKDKGWNEMKRARFKEDLVKKSSDLQKEISDLNYLENSLTKAGLNDKYLSRMLNNICVDDRAFLEPLFSAYSSSDFKISQTQNEISSFLHKNMGD